MSDDWPFENTEKRMAIAAVAPKTEPELLAAIDHQDHATRIVYADWLEEQGDFERAEFVRLQDRILELPDGSERDDAIQRATTLAHTLDAAWRVLVARPLIRYCKRDACPGEWGSLAPTHTSDLRICGTCQARIEYRFQTTASHDKPVVDDGGYERDWPDYLPTGVWIRRT